MFEPFENVVAPIFLMYFSLCLRGILFHLPGADAAIRRQRTFQAASDDVREFPPGIYESLYHKDHSEASLKRVWGPN